MIAKAGDDHCALGKIRPQDNNVTFGRPQHRGAEGGKVCELAFNNFIQAISVSNYYYEEKDAYLDSLNAVREQGYDLSPFLKFGLRGTALQSKRLLKEIKITFLNLCFETR